MVHDMDMTAGGFELRTCIECLDPFEVELWNGHPVHDRKRCEPCIKELFDWR